MAWKMLLDPENSMDVMGFPPFPQGDPQGIPRGSLGDPIIPSFHQATNRPCRRSQWRGNLLRPRGHNWWKWWARIYSESIGSHFWILKKKQDILEWWRRNIYIYRKLLRLFVRILGTSRDENSHFLNGWFHQLYRFVRCMGMADSWR